MLRVSLTFALLCAFVTIVASPANATNDPRVCLAPGVEAPLPAKTCAIRAAYSYIESYLLGRFHVRDGIVPAVVTCKTAGSMFRYACKFNGGWLYGRAIVKLGTAPTWKRTIKFRSFVCLVKRPGCPSQ